MGFLRDPSCLSWWMVFLYTKSGLAHGFIANCATCKLKDLQPATSTLTFWGFGINDSGVVVGQMTTNGGYHAVI
jgi:hypothetical protein